MSRSPSNDSTARSRTPRRWNWSATIGKPEQCTQTELTFNQISNQFEPYVDPVQLEADRLSKCKLEEPTNKPCGSIFKDHDNIFKDTYIQWRKEFTGQEYNDAKNWFFWWAIHPDGPFWFANTKASDGSNLWVEYYYFWKSMQTTCSIEQTILAIRALDDSNM